MIKMLTAHTFEIDDRNAVVREIQNQLYRQGALLKNTVGLLLCYLDFIISGTVEAICKALPFDTFPVQSGGGYGGGCSGPGIPGSSDFWYRSLGCGYQYTDPKNHLWGKGISRQNADPALFGKFYPPVFVDSVSKYNIHTRKALVTSAEGNRMITVNNIPAVEYMKKIGLSTMENPDAGGI
ncbi:MAG: hypothetical protein LBC60_13410 [Spirochaetaceae bacterium]|jgi:hypothetical protein|nr:hypothetical protein [Spirochaetaceae bacterium]